MIWAEDGVVCIHLSANILMHLYKSPQMVSVALIAGYHSPLPYNLQKRFYESSEAITLISETV